MEFVTSMLSMEVTGVYHIHGMCCETTDTLWNHLPKPKQTASGSLQNKYTPVPFVVPTKDLENYFIQQKMEKSNFFPPHRENVLYLPLKCFSLSHTHTHCRADSRGTAHLCEASWLWRPWEPSTCPPLSAIEKRRPAFTLHPAQSQAWQTWSV